MLGKIKEKLGKGGQKTVADLTDAMTKGLDLPSVYKPEVIHKSSGRVASGQKHLDLQDIDFGAIGSIGELKSEVERVYADDDLSVRITSPTDKDGISERMHLKTLREAAD